MTRKAPAELGGVQAVHRALILEQMLSEAGSLSVTEAADALGVNPSSAQRILATFVLAGFATQGEGRRYEPGPELLRPGVIHTVPLRARLRAHLESLYERTHETVHVAVLIGTEIHHLDGIEAAWPLRMGLRTGVRVPAHLASAGKVALAELADDEIRERYAGLDPDEGEAPRDMDAFLRDIAETRTRGVGVNLEETNPGVAGMASSLGRIDGSLAAFSLSMPIARYSAVVAEEHSGHLRAVAREARAALGT